MTVSHVEILVEEPSAETALRLLLPKMLRGVSFCVYPHSCKNELLDRLPERLRGYASWLPKDWRIVVVVDQDNDDCVKLKQQLEAMALEAGFATKSAPKKGQFSVVNRLAIEELEAWFFGDWEAVRKAYPKVSATVPSQTRYRKPDAIKGGTWEALERVLKSAGYFRTGLRKIEAARVIASHMDPFHNTSPSFGALREVLVWMSEQS